MGIWLSPKFGCTRHSSSLSPLALRSAKNLGSALVGTNSLAADVDGIEGIAAGVGYWPDGLGNELLSACIASVESAGIVRAAWSSGHITEAAELTELGTVYLPANPSLRNPVDWKWVVGTAIGVATLAVAILALFVACSLKINP